MSYETSEQSRFAGMPVELYEFVFDGVTYRYTSADTNVTYGGATYTPTPMVRATVASGEAGSDIGTLDLMFPVDHPFVALLMGPYGSGLPMSVTVRARHRDDPAAEFITGFLGQSAAVSLDSAELKITFASAQARLQRKLPRLQVSRQCPFMLYDAYCNVNPTAFQWTTTVVDITNTRLTLTGLFNQPDKRYFVGGVILLGGVVRGFIERQDDTSIYLLQPSVDIRVGDTVTLYAGCDRLQVTCHQRFGNAARYGGLPDLPQQSPFEGRGLGTGAVQGD